MNSLLKIIALCVGLLFCGQAEASDVSDFQERTAKDGGYVPVEMDQTRQVVGSLNYEEPIEEKPASCCVRSVKNTAGTVALVGIAVVAVGIVGSFLYLDFFCVSTGPYNCTGRWGWFGKL